MQYQFHTLDSGLRLVTIPMEGTRAVTVLVMVGTGSKYETKDINGISHFLEHMMFKGTAKRSGELDIARELESIGAQFNAFTSQEYTGYYAKASAEKTDIIMDVIFDIFLNSRLDEAEIQKERHVVVEEINMVNDDPRHIVSLNFEKLLYGDQPAGWPITGPKGTVLGLKRDQFVKYFNTHYIAGNTVVAIAGNIKPEEIKEKVTDYFSNIREGELFTKEKVVESQTVPQADIFYKETDQSHLILGFRAVSMHDERRYPLAVLGSILGGGMSSRLFSEVREKRGLAYYVSAGNSTSTDCGYFAVEAGVNNTKAQDAIKVILEQIKKVRDEGVTELELKQAIDQTVGHTDLAMESSNFLAQICANSVLFEGKVLTPEAELAKIKAVTREAIAIVAKEFLKEEGLNLALVGPFKDSEPFKKLLTL